MVVQVQILTLFCERKTVMSNEVSKQDLNDAQEYLFTLERIKVLREQLPFDEDQVKSLGEYRRDLERIVQLNQLIPNEDQEKSLGEYRRDLERIVELNEHVPDDDQMQALTEYRQQVESLADMEDLTPSDVNKETMKEAWKHKCEEMAREANAGA